MLADTPLVLSESRKVLSVCREAELAMIAGMADGSAPAHENVAQRLAAEARPHYRRYAGYLLLLAVGAILASLTLGTFPGPLGALVSVVLWAGPLVLVLRCFRGQRRVLQRFAVLHGVTIMTWASVWIITVLFGLMSFGHLPLWWLIGGIASALPPLVAAFVVLRAAR